jgi:hypothetical protein
VGFQLDFNLPLNAAAAQDPASYAVLETSKHGRKSTSRPVRFQAVYNASNHSVQLRLIGRPRFAQGGRITVSAAASSGIPDVANPGITLLVLAHARGIVS